MRFDLGTQPADEAPGGWRARRGIPFGQDRLGNNTEGATLITAGQFAGQVAVLDGYDVIGVPVVGHAALAPTKLFGIEPLAPIANPSGIAYAQSERRFFFHLQGQWNTLWVTEEDGTPAEPRPITYPTPVDPALTVWAEGMTCLPHGLVIGERLARALYVEAPQGAFSRLEILTLQGVVQREIRLGPPLDGPDTYILGITHLPPDAFQISLDDGSLWTVGIDGAVLSGPVKVPDLPMAEAFVRLNDGRFMAASYTAGKLLAFDSSLARDPSGDRTFKMGPGLSRPFKGVWDAESGRYAMLGMDRDFLKVLATVPPSRDAAYLLFRTSVPYVGVATLPDEGAFALSREFPPFGIDIVGRDGVVREQIECANVQGLPNQRIVALAYVPTTRQFALWLGREANKVWLISRAGALDGSFLVPPPFGALQYVSEGGQDRLHVWAAPTLHTFDLAGNVIATATPSLEGLVSPGGYVAGPGGQFLLIDANNSEVILRGP